MARAFAIILLAALLGGGLPVGPAPAAEAEGSAKGAGSRAAAERLTVKATSSQGGLFRSRFFGIDTRPRTVWPTGGASLNTYGMPGLIDMPTAESAPDGQLGVTMGSFSGMTRLTLSFQFTPRLTGSFRYAILQDCNCFGFSTYYDRSFDVHYQLFTEGRIRPAVGIGLRDLVGTGIYSGEYIVATKHVGRKLRLTGGIGWGRLGSYGSFPNPLGLGRRPKFTGGTGGTIGFNQWFRGPAALFAGVEWQVTPKLRFKAEYSSDAYKFETKKKYDLLDWRLPLNVAVDYQVTPTTRLSGLYMYGSSIGAQLSFGLNPGRRPVPGSLESAPVPVYWRPDDAAGRRLKRDTTWTAQADGPQILLSNLQTLMAEDGFAIEALDVSATRAELWFSNATYDALPQALGRAARMMTRVLPASIETFALTPVIEGMPVLTLTLSRSDIEALENAPAGAEKLWRRAKLSDAARQPPPTAVRNAALYPARVGSIGPYLRYSLFDPDSPFRGEVGARAQGRWSLRPGLSLSGSVIKRAIGNLHTVTRVSNSVLPHVRSDFGLYDRQADPALEYLTADWFFRPGRALFGRVSAGYLEYMFGGVSAELLWRPVDRRLALGAEINFVRQRDYNMLLGFRPYQVATGHVSAYWKMRNGILAQLDVGRYLAGDVGATLTVQRTFANGWKAGAFMTLTNVPFSTFGEGAFDKGIMLTIPLSWAISKPTKRAASIVIRPVTRDGGARLSVRNRLYPLLEGTDRDGLRADWGRFWR